jgi:hypothetical protein
MTRVDDSVITLASHRAAIGACGLCARPSTPLPGEVTVLRDSGVVARFDVCEYCQRAVRRLAATVSGQARLSTGVSRLETRYASAAVEVVDETAGPAIRIQEWAHPLHDGDGTFYVPFAAGVQRRDGTWAGWLEFRELGGTRVLLTNRETTQPNQGALTYWASGLQRSYLEGAFRRAQRPHVVRLT